jgi:hypothetical protein
MVIKGKLSTVYVIRGRSCLGPYMKRKHRTKVKCTTKYIKHSTNGKGCLSENRNARDRLAQWGAQLEKMIRWMPNDRVEHRVT